MKIYDLHYIIRSKRKIDLKKKWHDRHIKNRQFEVRDEVLLYDNWYKHHLGKLKIKWFNTYISQSIKGKGIVKLKILDKKNDKDL